MRYVDRHWYDKIHVKHTSQLYADIHTGQTIHINSHVEKPTQSELQFEIGAIYLSNMIFHNTIKIRID
jgi:hypothetical protein